MHELKFYVMLLLHSGAMLSYFLKKDKIDTILRLAGSALRDIPILQQHFR